MKKANQMFGLHSLPIGKWLGRCMVVMASLLLTLPNMTPENTFAQTTAGQGAITREQASAHLTSLLQVYQVTLTEEQRSAVVTGCRARQTNSLQPLRTQIGQTRQKYEIAIDEVEKQIEYVNTTLRSMSEDSSSMDLASFHLSTQKRNLQRTLSAYENSLDELLAIDCQVLPEAYVAGIYESRERQKLAEAAGTTVQEFFELELKQSMASVKLRLEQIEARDR